MLGTFNNQFSNESVYGWGDLCMLQRDALFYFFSQLTFWLCWVFAAVCGLSLVVVHKTSHRSGFSLLQSTGSVVVAHRLSCPATCGIIPGQGMELAPVIKSWVYSVSYILPNDENYECPSFRKLRSWHPVPSLHGK